MAKHALPSIYCLTLSETPWKSAFTREHLAALAIDATFIQGFYGPTLGLQPSCYCDMSSDGSQSFIHANQLGCLLSHLCALRAALASNVTEFIVFEDDIKLPDDFVSRWAVLRTAIPNTCQMVLLERGVADPSRKFHAVAPGLATAIPYPFGSAAIWWTRAAALTAISNLVPCRFPFDVGLIHRVYPFTGVLVAEPPFVTQRTGDESWPSSISKW